MSRKTAFVKVSGDLVLRDDVIAWLKWQSETEHYFLVICIGGGSQINDAFKSKGYPVEFGPLGRETKTFEERQLARDILETNQAEIQDLLAEQGIQATVIIPVLDIGSVSIKHNSFVNEFLSCLK